MSPKLTPAQVAAARESGRQYEANMAIEGMYLNALQDRGRHPGQGTR